MRLSVDANFLVAASLSGDEPSLIAARGAFANAELAAVSSTALCEFFWVMRSRFGQPRAEILDAVKALLADRRVVVADDAVSSGIAFAEAGGDFADGVIAFEGRRLGGTIFASFDRKANQLAREQGFGILPAPNQPLAG